MMLLVHFTKWFLFVPYIFFKNFTPCLKNKQQHFSFVERNPISLIFKRQYNRRKSFVKKMEQRKDNYTTLSKDVGKTLSANTYKKHDLKFIDIGANLCDKMFNGYYNGKRKHLNDLTYVLARAKAHNVEKIILTCGSLKEFEISLDICRKYDPECKFLYLTVGVHPTNIGAFVNRNMIEKEEAQAEQEYYKFRTALSSKEKKEEAGKSSCENFDKRETADEGTTAVDGTKPGSGTEPKSNENGGGVSAIGNSNNNNNKGNTINSNGYMDIGKKHVTNNVINNGSNNNNNNNRNNRNSGDTMEIYGFTYDKHAASILEQLDQLITKHKERVVCIGEIGIDCARLMFAPKHLQIKFFVYQLKLAEKHKLPLFLHMRDCADIFFDIVNKYKYIFEQAGGVIHSFTDDASIVDKIETYKNLYIGVNGCSFKTPQNLLAVKKIPLNRLLIETDAPWCGFKKSHAGFAHVEHIYTFKEFTKLPSGRISSLVQCGPNVYFKERNEPFNVGEVAEATYLLKAPSITLFEFCEQIRKNTLDLFPKLK